MLIEVPTNSSGTADGVARAPAVLRQRGLTGALAGCPGFTDAGDLALDAPWPGRGPSGLLAEAALITMIGRVREAVGAARRQGRFPLLVGGDCPVILGALAALQAERDRPGLLFVDGHEDAWPPRRSATGEAADCELGLALRLFDAELAPGLRDVLPRIRARDVIAVGPRDGDELAAAGVATLAGQLRALIRPAELAAGGAAGADGLPGPWWLHTDLDVLASAELAAVDYPQPGGLTWNQLSDVTAAALATAGSYSTDGGRTWSAPLRVTPDRDQAPHIVESAGGRPGVAYVAWQTSGTGPGYATYLRPFSIQRGWLGPAVKVSAAYGNVRIWPGDTFGIAPLPDGSISLTWGSAVGARKTSAIYASVVTI